MINCCLYKYKDLFDLYVFSTDFIIIDCVRYRVQYRTKNVRIRTCCLLF